MALVVVRARGPEKWMVPLLLLPVGAIYLLVVRGSWLLQATRPIVYMQTTPTHHHERREALEAGAQHSPLPLAAVVPYEPTDLPLSAEAWAGFPPQHVVEARAQVRPRMLPCSWGRLQQSQWARARR